MARAIAVEIVGDASSVNRAFKSASVSATRFDRSLGKSVRGAVAGTGVFRGLGRSLAFASGGFLAFEGIAGTISAALHGAEDLSKAQEGLSVAIKNTGGNLRVLKARYTEIAKGAQQFGVSQVDATTALEKATVLTGSAAKAQRAYEEALVISHAIGKDFNTTLTATAKAQEGITTSLQRYGIQIKKNTPGVQQLQIVMSRFRGEAVANTSAADRFRAVWANTEVILGQALLPVLDKYLTRLGDWLEKMQKTGRLQRDVNTAVHDAVDILHVLTGAVRGVNKITGSFKHTLELLLALKIASSAARWAQSFGLVGTRAARAETEAAGLLTKLRALAAIGTIAIVLDLIPRSSAGQSALDKVGLGFLGKVPIIGGLDTQAANFANKHIRPIFGEAPLGSGSKRNVVKPPPGYLPGTYGMGLSTPSNPGGFLTRTQLRKLGYDPSTYGRGLSTPTDPGGYLRLKHTGSTTPASSGPHSLKPIRELKIPQGLITAQLKAQAGLGSIVKADEAIRNYILRLLHSGRLRGKALQEAYQELASVNAELAGQVKKAAQKAKEAKKKADSFTEPLALQLAEARAQALGLPDKSILLKMKRAALRAIHSGKLSIQGQIDAWNQVASLNDQLKTATTTAAVKFKQASTKALTAGLGLSEAQRKALRARLSQLGPGGTVPNPGVGAYGYQIGNDNRPIVIHHTTKLDGKVVARNTTRHQQRHRRRNPSQRRGPNTATTG